jgi:hypothetical protein
MKNNFIIKTITLFIFNVLIVNNLIKAQSWSPLGVVDQLLEPNGKVNAMVKDSAGNIYVAGEFTDGASNISGNYYVAKWDGIHWSRLDIADTIINDVVNSLCFDNAGNLYAAGAIHSNVSGASAYDERYVAKWDGNHWSVVGGINHLNGSGDVNSICSDANGNIYAAGNFRNTANSCYVAKWNGSAWSEVGPLNGTWANSSIYTLTCDANGNIYAAGDFFNVITSKYVAKWNGSSWTELGGLNALAANKIINSICVDQNGNLYAAGKFTDAAGIPYVAKYNGSSWSNVGTFNVYQDNARNISQVICDSSGTLFAVGHFNQITVDKYYVAKWDTTNWTIFTDIFSGYDVSTNVICPKDNGDVFAIVQYGPSTYDKRWFVESNGSNTWLQNVNVTQLEFGYSSILTTCKDPAGNIYAAGNIGGSYGLNYVKCVAVWNGSTWSILGGIPNGLISSADIKSICSDALGNIYAEVEKPGTFTHSIAKWDGTSWSYLGDLTTVTIIRSMCTDPAGNLYVAGSITWPGVTGNCVLMYDGTYWTPVGGFGAQLQANASIRSIVTDSQGNLYAGGDFNNSLFYEYVAKWDGSSWSELGGFGSSGNTQGINALYCDENDNIYAGGDFISTLPNTYILKWNGINWEQLDGLTSEFTAVGANSSVESITTDAAGHVFVCGGFANTDGFFVVPMWDGTSWVESGGTNNLRANDRPRNLLRNGNTIYTMGDFQTPLRKRNYMAQFACDIIAGIAEVTINSASNYCAGSTAVINTNTSNAGTSPIFQWYLNGNLLSNNSASLSLDTLSNNDTLQCILMSNQSCLVNNVDTSDIVTLNVNFATTPSITFNGIEIISTSASTYQWYFNGVAIVGATSQNYTPTQDGDYSVETSDSNTCVASSSNLYVMVTGLKNNINESNKVSIYPNPASESILLRGLQNETIQIQNTFGQIVFIKNNCNSSETIDINGLANGMYYVINAENKIKFIKQ